MYVKQNILLVPPSFHVLVYHSLGYPLQQPDTCELVAIPKIYVEQPTFEGSMFFGASGLPRLWIVLGPVFAILWQTREIEKYSEVMDSTWTFECQAQHNCPADDVQVFALWIWVDWMEPTI